jgi:hypothetical protein
MIALACLIARYRKMPTGMLLAFTFSLACCWMTVLGPATESATYILLAPSLAWGIVLSLNGKTSRGPRIAYAAVFGLFIASQLAVNMGEAGKHFRQHLQPIPLAAVIFSLVVFAQTLGWGQFEVDQTSAAKAS